MTTEREERADEGGEGGRKQIDTKRNPPCLP